MPKTKEEKSKEQSKYFDVMVDIIDRNFPKGKCAERGKALVALAELEMLLQGIPNPLLSTSEKEPSEEKVGQEFSDLMRKNANWREVWAFVRNHGEVEYARAIKELDQKYNRLAEEKVKEAREQTLDEVIGVLIDWENDEFKPVKDAIESIRKLK